TCTPALPAFVLERWPEVDLITYLDADFFFFNDIEPAFAELAGSSIAITAHGFGPSLQKLEEFGRYNVGWVSFRRDKEGLRCLYDWRARCIEWCYDRLEGNRFADQKYLDEWPERFAGVLVFKHKGVNLAPWNVANFNLR